MKHESRFAAISKPHHVLTLHPGNPHSTRKDPLERAEGIPWTELIEQDARTNPGTPWNEWKGFPLDRAPRAGREDGPPGGHERPGLPAVKTHRRTQSQPRRTEAQRAPEAKQSVLRPSCRADR